MTIQEAIKKAIEGGYKMFGSVNKSNYWNGEDFNLLEKLFLDPEFWKCLGKAMRWGKNTLCPLCEAEYGEEFVPPMWQRYWHKLIEYLADGKSAEDYFKNLN